MMYPHPLIAKEGWPYLAVLGVLTLVVHSLGGFTWSWPLWILFFFVLQFFRDPQRIAPLGRDLVLSPADGRIVVVEVTQDPYAKREALKISVFMNVFNVHSNRSAVNGLVKEIQYFPGKFVNADLDKASLENERNAMVIDANGQTVTLVQVAGLIARRILCYVHVGDRLKAGERYGFIRFGSRVDIYLPLTAVPMVSVGDRVYATNTALARLPGLD
ncbi:phosphatidylserine decarboxylase [Polynucleobacter paneuropaeus]|jgi:phosphatidylserine decarboxylase|uniref:Phosphatidylserine decarboxylase proenzyme n=1 Tax=Polynucleobacter paneuropaeus TaxID=2527775 RepID=A0A2Z4JS24_9BURK|nr:phosphatidylserine decarboxylase [Polynucleobacter paneuropaeus]AWW44655.1 phosphatidylserine decarboxylase family protein [Polynucleobacter paneuropaeus]AWW49590.1 phosphatidylserine decarboxylase family protein [Polynucleobacter paneuropaeus]MBT8514458.1 phosphatidylserine decarboxylase [Polynucleobacter paneuropaeus]MBT8519278.1 phosphatidylserine decarboxylase [Polynucleobacter paneuropaeus]MBT8529978.1 phosphatidylserine decarboxylase [Polynucleobacter paneuropaeus]